MGVDPRTEQPTLRVMICDRNRLSIRLDLVGKPNEDGNCNGDACLTRRREGGWGRVYSRCCGFDCGADVWYNLCFQEKHRDESFSRNRRAAQRGQVHFV